MPQLTEADIATIRAMDLREEVVRGTLAGFLHRHLLWSRSASITAIHEGLDIFVDQMPRVLDQAAATFNDIVRKHEGE